MASRDSVISKRWIQVGDPALEDKVESPRFDHWFPHHTCTHVHTHSYMHTNTYTRKNEEVTETHQSTGADLFPILSETNSSSDHKDRSNIPETS